MEKVVQKFSSHAESDAANRAYYKSLTPQQRLEILFTLIENGKAPHERNQKPAKVFRIIDLGKS